MGFFERGRDFLEIRKEAGVGSGWLVGAEDLALINAQSRKTLTAEEVYAFTVRLCDNEIDRDWERFSSAALESLAEKFVGKSGVFDHQWSAKGQTARIYKTEVVGDEGITTGAGDGYRFLKGYAYMLRTQGNRDLIAEIEGGIKKEVSVGCAVAKCACSICGEEMGGKCVHVKGRSYGRKLCWGELDQVTDAYEWSFVAVPAQRKAGVMKQFGKEGRNMDLRKALEGQESCLCALEALEGEAEVGRRYLSALRAEVARLGGLVEPEMDGGVRKSIADKLDEAELLELKKRYEGRVAERFPVGVQLSYRGERDEGETRDGAFLI